MIDRIASVRRFNRAARKYERAERWHSEAFQVGDIRKMRRATALLYGYDKWMIENGPDGMHVEEYAS